MRGAGLSPAAFSTDVDGDGQPGLPDGARLEELHITNCDLAGVGAHIWLPDGGRITIPLHCPGGEVIWERGMTAPIVR